MSLPSQLEQIAELIKQKPDHFSFTSPREVLAWFGKYRRTWQQVQSVRSALAQLNLETYPDFEGAGFDEPILIRAAGRPASVGSETIETTTTADPNPQPVAGALSSVAPAETSRPVDPVHRVSRLLPSSALISVTKDSSLQNAITKMLINDFSQLPVMQGDRKVDGVISWASIGKRQALGNNCETVAHCMEPHYEVKGSDSIFSAIRMIKEYDFVLVRSDDQRIIGILTATDISVSFEQVSKPFLMLSYIENHLRTLIKEHFKVCDLQTAKDPSDKERVISDVSNMTFGEYIRLLESPESWAKLNLKLDRKLFIDQINEVRNIRNNVMHFNPEGIKDEDMESLRRVNSFLEFLVRGQSK